MKICPVCQMGNSDESITCKECGTSVSAVAAQDTDAILKAESDQYERRQRRLKNLKITGVILASALHISFFAISIIRGTFLFPVLVLLLMPAVGYRMIFHAEAMFRFKINMSGDYEVKGEVSPSEWYLLKSTIAGAFVILISVIYMGLIAFH